MKKKLSTIKQLLTHETDFIRRSTEKLIEVESLFSVEIKDYLIPDEEEKKRNEDYTYLILKIFSHCLSINLTISYHRMINIIHGDYQLRNIGYNQNNITTKKDFNFSEIKDFENFLIRMQILNEELSSASWNVRANTENYHFSNMITLSTSSTTSAWVTFTSGG